MRRNFAIAIALSVFALPALGQTGSQTGPSTGPVGPTNGPMYDQHPKDVVSPPAKAVAPPADEFVTKAAMGDIFEIEAGKIAQQRGQKPEVRDFGARMVKDHSEALETLSSAVRDGKREPRRVDLDSAHMKKLDALRNASDASFDRLYIRTQLQAHREALGLLKAYGQQGDDAGLRQVADTTLPVVQGHMNTLSRLRRAVQ
jgi:putative membrane protein